MAYNGWHPEEKYREQVFSLFKVLAEKKCGPTRGASRGEIVKEVKASPGRYSELNGLSEGFLKSCITKILNKDPRVSINGAWRNVWILRETAV